MTAERVGRTDAVTASYFRKGRCAVCGKGVERTRSFLGESLSECNRRADLWLETPLVHRRCEVPA